MTPQNNSSSNSKLDPNLGISNDPKNDPKSDLIDTTKKGTMKWQKEQELKSHCTIICGHCRQSWEGQVGIVREHFKRHLETVHPDVHKQPRTRRHRNRTNFKNIPPDSLSRREKTADLTKPFLSP